VCSGTTPGVANAARVVVFRRTVADLNRIRARLPGARSEAAKPPERGQPPPLQQDALAEARSSDLELELEHERSRREELDAVVAALQDELSSLLADAGLRVLTPERLPPNDGGIAYGQLAVAAARLAAEDGGADVRA
jgi:hypothetical protein